MVRSSSILLLLVLVSVLGTSYANWYGKRSDRADFFNFMMRQRLDNYPSRDMNAEVALAAIDQVLQLYRQHRADNSLNSELKQAA